MKAMHMLAFILLVVGGLNWLLVAFGYNVVEMILGEATTATKVVYVLVGLSALYIMLTHKKDCRVCSKQM